jgi:hypothetical protein
MNRTVLFLYGVLLSLAGRAVEPALAGGAPDFTGITAQNFFDKIPATRENGFGDYVMPKVDPAKAFIVDTDAVGGKPNDENPGTVERPFKTLTRAFREIKPGAVILLRKGTYPLEAGLTIDGAAGQKGSRQQPALVSSYPGETAVLVGSKPLTGWKKWEESNVYVHDLDAAIDKRTTVWVNGQILPSIRRHVLATTTNAPFKEASINPLDGALPVSEAGTWAFDGKRFFLRAPSDADPGKLRVEFDIAPHDGGSITLAQSESVIFHRLAFRRHAQAVLCVFSPYAVFRDCVFEDCLLGISFHGGDKAERGFVDRCLFYRNGDRTHGTPIYTTSPMTIRHSLFVDIGPMISVTAYTSKPDMFTGLQVVGNTFLHGGACITSTGKRSVIKNNIVFGSRFLSSAGSEAVIEDNLAVYDAKDLTDSPLTPRRDIGIRMYGRNSKLKNNTLIGFAQGCNIYKPEGDQKEPAPVEVSGNQFYKYDDYGLRIYDPENLRCDETLYAPATTNALPVYLTPDPKDHKHLTLAEWKAKGFDKKGRFEPGAKPSIPRVIQEAMTK